MGNFVGLWLTDTSTRHVILPTSGAAANAANRSGSTGGAGGDRRRGGGGRWEFCASCESVQPPRAWHCSVCGVCVLKREHHCMFVGYCVGHRNHRYFCLFLWYMWAAVLYCTYFNTRFLATHIDELTWAMVPKFVFPLMSLLTFDLSWLQVTGFKT